MPASTSRPTRTPVVAHDLTELRRELVALLPELRGRALRLTGMPSVADDLAQDAVERALRFSEQYERGTNLRAWAMQILFSVFITRYRRGRREKNALRTLAGDPCAWTLPQHFSAPDTTLDLTPATRDHLQALPQGFRSAVILVDLEERSYREAADELGVPVGTVMSRLHRGRRLLAARMAA